MSEIGSGISEIRPTRDNSQDRGQAHQAPFLGQEPQLAKSWKDRVRSLALKVAGEQEFRPEDYEVPAISRDILDRAGNRMTGATNQERNMPVRFDIRDILSIKGQVRAMGNPNSPAYRAANQALNSLVREGALEAEELPEEFHGVFRQYLLINPDKLQELSDSSEEQ